MKKKILNFFCSDFAVGVICGFVPSAIYFMSVSGAGNTWLQAWDIIAKGGFFVLAIGAIVGGRWTYLAKKEELLDEKQERESKKLRLRAKLAHELNTIRAIAKAFEDKCDDLEKLYKNYQGILKAYENDFKLFYQRADNFYDCLTQDELVLMSNVEYSLSQLSDLSKMSSFKERDSEELKNIFVKTAEAADALMSSLLPSLNWSFKAGFGDKGRQKIKTNT